MIFDIKKSVKGVRDHDRYKDDGLYNVERIVVESSNIGTAQIALKIGKEFQKDFLGEIPINPDVGNSGDQGKPIVESNPDHEISKIYLDFAEKIKSNYL